jgi:hypothetical protein
MIFVNKKDQANKKHLRLGMHVILKDSYCNIFLILSFGE